MIDDVPTPELVAVLVDNRKEKKLRSFLATAAYDFEDDPKLTELIKTEGVFIVWIFRGVNSRRKHGVGFGAGSRVSVQQRMQFTPGFGACNAICIYSYLFNQAPDSFTTKLTAVRRCLAVAVPTPEVFMQMLDGCFGAGRSVFR